MLRSVISMISPRRRIAVLASASVLATVGTLAIIGTASASGTPAASARPRCSNATLKGTYTFGYIGWSISAGKSSPFSAAGFDRFNGAGTSHGVITINSNGVVVNNNTPDTSTYTIKANCTGKVVFNTAGSLAHFNVYLSPSGKLFSLVETDPGSLIGGTETRVAR